MPVQEWIRRKLRRFVRAVVTPGLLLGGVAAMSVAASGPAFAVGTYNNADIATDGLAELGQNLGSVNGQCKAFANAMVHQASGGTQSPSGYQSGWQALGTQVSSANAVEGDIIQITPAGSTDNTAESIYSAHLNADGSSPPAYHLHTAIIVSNNGNDSFTVVDANFTAPYTVGKHTFDPYTWAAGSIVDIWRLGTVSGGNGASHGIGRPSALYNPSTNTEQVYAIGTDGNVYLWFQQDPNNGFVEASLPGADVAMQGSPSALYNPSNNEEQAYAIGTNGDMYIWFQSSPTSGFNTPVQLPGSAGMTFQGSPSAVYNPSVNEEQVYGIATNGNMYIWIQSSPTSGFTGPIGLPTGVTFQGSPAAIYNPSTNTEQVYAIGTDGNVYLWFQTDPTGGFTGPTPLPGAGNVLQGSPAVVYNPSVTEEQVYAIGTDGDWYIWTQPSPTGGFNTPGGYSAFVQGTPSALYNPSTNTEQVYVIGTDGDWNIWVQSSPTSGFSESAPYAGPLQGSPVALYNPSTNTEQLYGFATNGDLYQWWQADPTSVFSGPAPWAGTVGFD